MRKFNFTSHSIGFVIILLVGVFVRVAWVAMLPYGHNQDELNATYSAWSLLNFGTDHWGNPWPVYFPSWGSGQNVLYSYLTIPVVALFGTTTFSIRAVAVIFGILLIPLMYALTKRWFDKKIALWVMVATAVMPVFIMSSRWGVEVNILPTVAVFALYMFTIALQDPHQRWWKVSFSLIPFAIAGYTYISALIPIAVFLVAVLIWKRKFFLQHAAKWAVAAGLFVITVAPIGLYLLKITVFNNKAYFFEKYLPFSLPPLTESRVDQIVMEASPWEVFTTNLFNVISGFASQPMGMSPSFISVIPGFFFILAAFAVVLSFVPKYKELFPFTMLHLWHIACSVLVLVIPLNANRANILYASTVILSVALMYQLIKHMTPLKYKKISVGGILLVSGAYLVFWGYHYVDTRADLPEFNQDMQQALMVATEEAEGIGEVILVEPKLELEYMQVMWYFLIPPSENVTFEDPEKALRNYVFEEPRTSGYYAVTRAGNVGCEVEEFFYLSPTWAAYKCK